MGFSFDIFWNALTSSAFLEGSATTIILSLLAMILATLLALPLALGQRSHLAPVRGFVFFYVWLFRGAPTLLQLLFVWNALPLFIPALQASWFTPFIGALVALTFNEAAYMTEITRAALIAVDEGQRLAGRALGMSQLQVLRHVILPQAVRVAIPPMANEFITLVKLTSLASVISLRELLTVTQQTVAVNFRFMELYSAALVYYMVIVTVLMVLQSYLERRLRWTSAKKPKRGAPTLGQALALPGTPTTERR